MPRDIPVGNGKMLVNFDQHYQIRDLYYPHVGQENHAGHGPCRFGVWGDLPGSDITPTRAQERRRHHVCWSSDGWDTQLGYHADTLATDVVMRHHQLKVDLRCEDVVDYHRCLYIRRIEVHNRVDQDRPIHLFHHHDFRLYGTNIGDTAYYDPQLRSIVHYRKKRYLMASFHADGDQRIDEYATGTAGFGGHEGTWRDAEDGHLGNNPIAQGAVDSTIMARVALPASGRKVLYLVIGAGECYEDLTELHKFLHRTGPQGAIDRTKAYWKLWLGAVRDDAAQPTDTGLSQQVVDLYKRSLLLVRTQVDNDGAIIAANDSDYLQFSRDTYSYLWPRDGAFVADAMDGAGFGHVARSFFKFCADIITDKGCFLHKYTPDGMPASSWHPWVNQGKPQMPIQEDETALVVWALWRHFYRYRDIEFVRRMWIRIVQPAADFLVRYRDPDTNLPLPSYDLWEERFGVHSFTVATVYGGLMAAHRFAVCFGDKERAERYRVAAEQTREAFCKYLWSDEHDRFLRRVTPADQDRTARFMQDILSGRTPTREDARMLFSPEDATHAADEIVLEPDDNIDASMFAIFAMGLLPVDDPRVQKTMDAVHDRLWCNTDVGGVARYVDDYYHQVTKDTERVPGNPWFICTLWVADYQIAKATMVEELEDAAELLDWVAERALPSGVLAEQVHPETNAPLSVSPLTWSHATVVATVTRYLDKWRSLAEEGNAGLVREAALPDDGAVSRASSRRVTSPIPEM